MIGGRKIILTAALGLLLAGCDDPSSTTGPATPATQPSQAAAPATQPARTTTGEHLPTARPAAFVSSFRIFEHQTPNDFGMLYEFPHARLHLKRDENSVVLYTDDPGTAIKPSYSGNSYYLVVPLSKSDPEKLDGYIWHYQAPSIDEHPDSGEGVFLDGQRYHLQPSDVTIAFKGAGRQLKVAVIGQFVKFDTAANQSLHAGYPVLLKGTIDATVDAEK